MSSSSALFGQPRPPTILVFAAHEPELAGVRALLGAGRTAMIGGHEVQAHPVGIGLPAAACGAARLLHEVVPAAVVFVGTAGAYEGHGLTVGSVVLGRGLLLASSAVAEGRAAYPGPMPVRASSDPELLAGLAAGAAALPLVEVATTLAVTTDDALAGALSRAFGCAVEHLEAVAVAMACQDAAIPIAVVLGIANRVGASGRDEWREHHHAAGLAAARVVGAWLTRGAPGVRTSRPAPPLASR